ncbi:pollen-specific leucine-rich repeat extensin-like protein 4 [Iris pallida]|uniref:Pollen-specific leucine-rich repeat extensin-like protein 4 n=1 Tax=Iris pallida TaxID=29817 RepID=A0AAX6DVV2_IRIPA|nr:pollen-specific leucine-rich repeat extensin-like protein 4 [Iris pallida]
MVVRERQREDGVAQRLSRATDVRVGKVRFPPSSSFMSVGGGVLAGSVAGLSGYGGEEMVSVDGCDGVGGGGVLTGLVVVMVYRLFVGSNSVIVARVSMAELRGSWWWW